MNYKLYHKIVILLLFLFISTTSLANTNSKIVFRIDDFGNDNTEFYYKLFDLFQSYNFPLTVGVIPFEEKTGKIVALDSTEVRLLRKEILNGYLEIAQHGYTHKNIIDARDFKSEFYGLPFKTQFNKILSGKKSLEKQLDYNINIFIPPFNSYDSTTLKVLEKTGFDILSPALYGKAGICKTNVSIIPYTVTLKEFIQNKNKILKDLSINNRIVIILFHTYNFYCNEDYFKKHSKYNLKPSLSFDDLSNLLSEISLNDNIEVTNFSKLNDINDFSYEKYKKNFIKNPLVRTPNLHTIKNKYYYDQEPNNNILKQILIDIAYPIFFYLVSFFLPFVFVKILLKLFMIRKKILKLLSFITIALLISSICYSLRDGNLGPNSITFFIFCLGLLMGFVNHFYISNSNHI